MGSARPLLAHALLAAWAGLSAVACDRVGGALVDHQNQPPVIDVGPVPCTPPPPCADPVEPFSTQQALSIAPGDIERTCSLQIRNCAAAIPDEDDAGTEAWTEGGAEGSTEGGTAGCRFMLGPEEATAYDGSRILCSRLVIEADGSGPDRVRLSGIDWSHVNITLSASVPFTLELEQAELDDVYVKIAGSATLRIVDATLDDLRVTGEVTEAGRPRLELEHVQDAGVRIGGAQQVFAGRVAITRALLTNPQLVVEELALQSVIVEDAGLIEAQLLTALDGEMTGVVLQVGEAVLSAYRLQDCQVRECAALTLIASELERTPIAACRDQPLRAYSSKVTGGSIDGLIESDQSQWARVRLGLRAPTDLVVWDGSFQSTNFCAQTRSARFGASANVRCSECEDGGLESEDAICIEPGIPPDLEENFCQALRAPAACRDPGERVRPLSDDL
jgi:hypothetical protein